MNYIAQLIKSKKTVFRYENLSHLVKFPSKKALDQFLFRAKKNGELLNPTRGIRTLPVFQTRELAYMLKDHSYISLETVLYDAGAIFQAYFHTITCIANEKSNYKIEGIEYRYNKIKDEILFNDLFVKDYENFRLATPERALCDYIYLFPRAKLDVPEVFQNPSSLVRFEHLLPIYPQKTQIYIRRILNTKF